MRKALIAVIVATALFAAGAFAAQFTVNAEDVASGRDSVIGCADTVNVVFPPAVWDDTQKRYEVTKATFTFLEEGALATRCDTLDATWRIELPGDTDDTNVLVVTNGVIEPVPSAAYLTTTPGLVSGWAVSDIEGAAVLIEDVLLTSNGVDTALVDPFPPPAP